MKVHLRTHSDIFPYECNFCHRRFRERGSIQRHTRIHTGDKPYQCRRFCFRRFAEHGTLNRHLKAKGNLYCNILSTLVRIDACVRIRVEVFYPALAGRDMRAAANSFLHSPCCWTDVKLHSINRFRIVCRFLCFHWSITCSLLVTNCIHPRSLLYSNNNTKRDKQFL